MHFCLAFDRSLPIDLSSECIPKVVWYVCGCVRDNEYTNNTQTLCVSENIHKLLLLAQCSVAAVCRIDLLIYTNSVNNTILLVDM